MTLSAIPALYLVASTVSLALYGLDKVAAIRGASRVPEFLLHLLGLAGGWPGGFLAQRLFRHKCSKRNFRIAFWGVALCNTTIAAALFF